ERLRHPARLEGPLPQGRRGAGALGRAPPPHRRQGHPRHRRGTPRRGSPLDLRRSCCVPAVYKKFDRVDVVPSEPGVSTWQRSATVTKLRWWQVLLFFAAFAAVIYFKFMRSE